MLSQTPISKHVHVDYIMASALLLPASWSLSRPWPAFSVPLESWLRPWLSGSCSEIHIRECEVFWDNWIQDWNYLTDDTLNQYRQNKKT